MDAREFLRHYSYDERIITGKYFPDESLAIEKGDTIGIVLLNLGGPNRLADIEGFLYNLFMDPAIIDLPLGGIFRHWLCSLIASKRSRKVAVDYEKIGGGSPINRLTQGQRDALELKLNQDYGTRSGVKFRVYVAMRYWHPMSEEAAAQMKKDGVTKVVLLPLYPHYSKTTTGSSLVFWWLLEQQGEIPKWPTTYLYEYSTHPKFVAAISARIEEGLLEFPVERRDQVHLLFSAHGTPLYEMKKRRDPYCCLIHSTVQQVMSLRKSDRPHHISFQSKVGPAEWLTPSTPDKLRELAEQGVEDVLVIPVAFVTDHIETAYELDIQIREEAEKAGIKNYRVTGGLNSHPYFIEALAEATMSRLRFPESSRNGASVDHAQLAKFTAAERTCRCHQCEHITEALHWHSAEMKSEL